MKPYTVIASEAKQCQAVGGSAGRDCFVACGSSQETGWFANPVKCGASPPHPAPGKARLCLANPTQPSPPKGGEGRVRGLLPQNRQFHPEGSATRPVWNS